jgi:hypothetical protein
MFNPDRSRVATGRVSAGDVKEPDFKGTVPANAAPSYEGPQMLEMTSENFARLLRGLTIAVGKRKTVSSYISFWRQRSGLYTVHMASETESPTKERSRFWKIVRDIRCALWSAGRLNTILR